MSEQQIKVPDIGDFDEVAVIEVLVKVGDTVKAEQSLITVESDKASMEIPSSAAGTVKAVAVKIGDKVKQGSVVLTLEVAEGAAAAPAAAPAPAAAAPAKAAEPPPQPFPARGRGGRPVRGEGAPLEPALNPTPARGAAGPRRRAARGSRHRSGWRWGTPPDRPPAAA